jgi:sugar phosphate isomerase/epimerase
MFKTSASITAQYDNPFSPFLSAERRQGFQWAADSGFDAVEIIWSNPRLIDIQSLAEELAKITLPIATIATGQACALENISLTDGAEYIRAAAVDRMKRNIDASAALGRPNVTVGLIRGKGNPANKKTERELLKAELGKVLDHAAKNGVRINLEPLNRYEASLLNTCEETLCFIREMGEPEHLGDLYDTFHSNMEDASMPGAIEALGKWISHVHIADSSRRLPTEGHIHFPSVMAALQKIGYEHYISLEVLNMPDAEHIKSNAGRCFRSINV